MLLSGLFLLMGSVVSLIIFDHAIFSHLRKRTYVEVSAAVQIIKREYFIGDIFALRQNLDNLAASQKWDLGEFKNRSNEVVWRNQRETVHNRDRFDLTYTEDIKFLDEALAGTLTVRTRVLDEWLSSMKAASLILLMFWIFWGGYILICWIVAKKTLYPLHLLKSDIQSEVSRANLDYSDNVDIDEIGQMRLWFRHLVEAWIKSRRESEEKIRIESFNALASQVAHDIRSPLTALDVATRAKIDPKAQMEMIKTSISRIRAIANDLLTSKKLMGSGRTREHVPSLVHSLINEKRFEYLARGEILQLNCDVASETGYCLLDSSQFNRALSNVINNAIEVTSDEANVQVSVSVDDLKVYVQVRDTGGGIPPHLLDRIGNEPISYGKESSNYSGAGLGLFSAKKILKEWGGDIIFASVPSCGTTVTLSIPLSLTSLHS